MDQWVHHICPAKLDDTLRAPRRRKAGRRLVRTAIQQPLRPRLFVWLSATRSRRSLLSMPMTVHAPLFGPPVGQGVVASLARPDGNLTGFSNLNTVLHAKRLELLSELVPQAKVIALLVNPNNVSTERIIRDVQEAARVKTVQLAILKAGTEDEIDAAFATLLQKQAGALVVGSDSFFYNQREQLVALASRHAAPAIYVWKDFPAAGGLISYGVDTVAILRHVGILAGRVLKDEKLAEPAGAAADQIRDGDQPEDRRGARPGHPAFIPRPRRRGDRVGRRAAASGPGCVKTARD
jgi:hypothetical protein